MPTEEIIILPENTSSGHPPHIQARLDRIEAKTRFLDSQFTVPGTKFRFGWDPIIGLVPYLGDFAGAAASLYIIYLAAHEGASGKAVLKMFGNVWIDTLLGFIPGLGIVLDFTFKANDRNLKILKDNIAYNKNSGSGLDLVLIFLGISIAALGFIAYLLYKLVKLVAHYIDGL